MKTMQKRSPFTYIPGYSKNAVIQLIIVCGTAFVTYQFLWAIMRMTSVSETEFNTMIRNNVSVYTLSVFRSKPWTLLTYGWLHYGFWELLTNMLWLYCFGNLIQVLVGYKQVIPIFVYSILMGGIFYLLCQLIPGAAFQPVYYLMGAQAGLMGLMTASVVLAPDYKFFFMGDRFRVSILAIAGIFLFLMILNSRLLLPQLFLLLGGGLTGLGYMLLVKKGYRPGAWMYDLPEKIGNMTSPDENAIREKKYKKQQQELMRQESKLKITEKRVDDILDKINQKGYNSLTKEEKEILDRAGKEN